MNVYEITVTVIIAILLVLFLTVVYKGMEEETVGRGKADG